MYFSDRLQARLGILLETKVDQRKVCEPNPLAFLTGELPKNHPAILLMVLIGRGLLEFLYIDLPVVRGLVKYAVVDVEIVSSSKDEGQLSAGLDKE